MIDVTEKAKKELKKLLDANVDWPGACLRLMERDNGKLGLGVDIEAPGDKLIEHDGKVVLVVDSKLDSSLNRITLDVEETAEGAKLVIVEEK